MPERAGTGCSPHHNRLVMNTRPLPTLVDLQLCIAFPGTFSGSVTVHGGELNLDGPMGGFITFLMARSCPCTAVDSTFQVLLFSIGNDTFEQTAQSPELIVSPFRATVRVRR